MSAQSAQLPKGTRFCRIGTWSAAVGLLLIALSSGHKLGFLPSWQMAFLALGVGGIAMVVAVVTTSVGLVRSGNTAGAASPTATKLAFFAALIFIVIAGMQLRIAVGVPPIHDVSTDTANPPQFIALVPMRQAAGAVNPAEYAGAETAALQAEGYRDIVPIVLPVPTDVAFKRAQIAAQGMGWEIVATVPLDGRIEAVATTGWIGFKDDVVIRVAAGEPGQSLVDIRSKSRVGRGDAGMNASRIRGFRDRLTSVK
jgi:uncharacterized protein (DUF1499 family)